MSAEIEQQLNADIKDILDDALPKVVADFKKMPGSEADAIKLLNTFKQSLMNYQAAYKADPKSAKLDGLIESLAEAAASSVLPQVAGQIAVNAAIGKMQPLNTKRIITPKTASAYNVNLEAFQDDVQGLVSMSSALTGGGGEDPIDVEEAAASLLPDLAKYPIKIDLERQAEHIRLSGVAAPVITF